MNYAAARHNMVENQVRTNRVTDPQVILALDEVPREVFVPKPLRGVAYVDSDIDLGGGRSLMGPLPFARLLQAAAIQPHEVVLDVGAATGYSSAVLARLASTVVALESDADMADRATALVGELGADNVAVVTGALSEGSAAHGPYDVIVLEGAVSHIPETLVRQLADGGRLVAVVRGETGLGHATVVTRVDNTFTNREIFDAAVVPLPGFQAQSVFVF